MKKERYEYQLLVNPLLCQDLLVVVDLLCKKKVFLAHKKWISFTRGYVFLPTISDSMNHLSQEDRKSYFNTVLTNGVTVGKRSVSINFARNSPSVIVRGGRTATAGVHRKLNVTWKPFPLKAVLQDFGKLR